MKLAACWRRLCSPSQFGVVSQLSPLENPFNKLDKDKIHGGQPTHRNDRLVLWDLAAPGVVAEAIFRLCATFLHRTAQFDWSTGQRNTTNDRDSQSVCVTENISAHQWLPAPTKTGDGKSVLS